ncbi:hypothetical protein KV100_12860 [Mumia sp. zg.B21]|uniref:hypothetical protein n=1 Tax=Mumia sp. zg.B21 TaxID=2855447 RepID=UPI001C6ED965|nr:hypothetical protein [Mumia sp. zg.B21]MBW9210545.1 hypothetical protein [Mumia sp. zg.B21]
MAEPGRAEGDFVPRLGVVLELPWGATSLEPLLPLARTLRDLVLRGGSGVDLSMLDEFRQFELLQLDQELESAGPVDLSGLTNLTELTGRADVVVTGVSAPRLAHLEVLEGRPDLLERVTGALRWLRVDSSPVAGLPRMGVGATVIFGSDEVADFCFEMDDAAEKGETIGLLESALDVVLEDPKGADRGEVLVAVAAAALVALSAGNTVELDEFDVNGPER